MTETGRLSVFEQALKETILLGYAGRGGARDQPDFLARVLDRVARGLWPEGPRGVLLLIADGGWSYGAVGVTVTGAVPVARSSNRGAFVCPRADQLNFEPVTAAVKRWTEAFVGPTIEDPVYAVVRIEERATERFRGGALIVLRSPNSEPLAFPLANVAPVLRQHLGRALFFRRFQDEARARATMGSLAGRIVRGTERDREEARAELLRSPFIEDPADADEILADTRSVHHTLMRLFVKAIGADAVMVAVRPREGSKPGANLERIEVHQLSRSGEGGEASCIVSNASLPAVHRWLDAIAKLTGPDGDWSGGFVGNQIPPPLRPQWITDVHQVPAFFIAGGGKMAKPWDPHLLQVLLSWSVPVTLASKGVPVRVDARPADEEIADSHYWLWHDQAGDEVPAMSCAVQHWAQAEDDRRLLVVPFARLSVIGLVIIGRAPGGMPVLPEQMPMGDSVTYDLEPDPCPTRALIEEAAAMVARRRRMTHLFGRFVREAVDEFWFAESPAPELRPDTWYRRLLDTVRKALGSSRQLEDIGLTLHCADAPAWGACSEALERPEKVVLFSPAVCADPPPELLPREYLRGDFAALLGSVFLRDRMRLFTPPRDNDPDRDVAADYAEQHFGRASSLILMPLGDRDGRPLAVMGVGLSRPVNQLQVDAIYLVGEHLGTRLGSVRGARLGALRSALASLEDGHQALDRVCAIGAVSGMLVARRYGHSFRELPAERKDALATFVRQARLRSDVLPDKDAVDVSSLAGAEPVATRIGLKQLRSVLPDVPEAELRYFHREGWAVFPNDVEKQERRARLLRAIAHLEGGVPTQADATPRWIRGNIWLFSRADALRIYNIERQGTARTLFVCTGRAAWDREQDDTFAASLVNARSLVHAAKPVLARAFVAAGPIAAGWSGSSLEFHARVGGHVLLTGRSREVTYKHSVSLHLAHRGDAPFLVMAAGFIDERNCDIAPLEPLGGRSATLVVRDVDQIERGSACERALIHILDSGRVVVADRRHVVSVCGTAYVPTDVSPALLHQFHGVVSTNELERDDAFELVRRYFSELNDRLEETYELNIDRAELLRWTRKRLWRDLGGELRQLVHAAMEDCHRSGSQILKLEMLMAAKPSAHLDEDGLAQEQFIRVVRRQHGAAKVAGEYLGLRPYQVSRLTANTPLTDQARERLRKLVGVARFHVDPKAVLEEHLEEEGRLEAGAGRPPKKGAVS